MSFNPEQSKHAQEVVFSRKLKNVPHPPLGFNSANVSRLKFQKHIGTILGLKLTFEDGYKTALYKTNNTIGLLRKLQNLLPGEALKAVNKAFGNS